MDKNSRYRCYTMVFYAGIHELEKILLKNLQRIRSYAYVLHDKDIYADDLLDDDGNYVHRKGDLEKPHIQIIIEFYNALSATALKRLFTTENDKPQVQRVVDKVAMYEYLIHKNDPDKYQYPKTDIKSCDINYWESICKNGEKSNADDKACAIINDLLLGVSPRILMHRYGRDLIIHLNQYKDYVDYIREYDVSHRLGNDDDFDEFVERQMVDMGL